MKISIVIPTRDRAETLCHTLSSCVRLKDDIEIVVSDNHSTDATHEVVCSFNDSRIRYVKPRDKVSQRLNFENGIEESTGDYVFIIGDDDGMLAHSFGYAAGLLKAERPDALSVPSVYYRWPTQGDPSGGRLKLKRKNFFGELSTIEAADYRTLVETAKLPRQDFSPKVYHGFASRGLLKRMKSRTGWYIASGQIDAYFATAALACMERYLFLAHPVSMLAMGPKSGGSSIAEQHREGGPRNKTAEIVAAEAADDPVKDPIDGAMPVLLMYLLNGMEQANRYAFDCTLAIDYAAYMRMIADQLNKVPLKARHQGMQQLEGFLHSVGRPELGSELRDMLHSDEVQSIKRVGRLRPLKSYLTPEKIALDLGTYGCGNVLAAVQAVDYLIGPINDRMPDPLLAWTKTMLRGVGHLTSAKLGFRPEWG